jgi:hypothetical protein
MTHATDISARYARRIARWAGLVTCAAAALAGWVFDIEFLKSVAPGRRIRPLSAVALALVGFAITRRARTGTTTLIARSG